MLILLFPSPLMGDSCSPLQIILWKERGELRFEYILVNRVFLTPPHHVWCDSSSASSASREPCQTTPLVSCGLLSDGWIELRIVDPNYSRAQHINCIIRWRDVKSPVDYNVMCTQHQRHHRWVSHSITLSWLDMMCIWLKITLSLDSTNRWPDINNSQQTH